MFYSFTKKMQAQFNKMCATGKLFTVNIDVDKLWDLYIKSFKEGDDPVFRHPDSTSHTCNDDKHFIKKYGNIVAIIDNKIITIWDLKLDESDIYFSSCSALSNAVKNSVIDNVFVISFDFLHKTNYEKTNKNQHNFRLGREKTYVSYTEDKTFGNVKVNKTYEFWFFHVYLPKSFVDFSSKTIDSIKGEFRTTRQLFEKTLSIPLETLEVVRDLIQQGSLLRGDMYLSKVLEVIKLKKKYEQVINKQLWLWDNFQSIPFARFANELIGTTCIELAEGKNINQVKDDFNYRVDPINFQKAKNLELSEKVKAEAEKQIQELGYNVSFERRFATIDDIDINEIKHSNINNTIEKHVGLFGKAGVPTNNQFNRHKRAEFDKVETVTIDKFMTEILPNVQSLEVFVENKMEGNLISLFTEQKSCKNLFKWNNPFSWTYNGNLSGKSMIKDNVKAVGGKITGILRCSLQWNDEDTKGAVDYDLHCKTPFTTIYYSSKNDYKSGGQLDVDMIRPSKIGIENITWQNQLLDGKYEFIVDTFCDGYNTGFKVEIEFNGNVYNYHYSKKTTYKSKTIVATVNVKNGIMSIEHHQPESSSSRKLWNLDTNQFHKVNLVCTSPNHWGDNNIGTKEYFFMLQDCKTDKSMRAFHVDQLNSELMGIRKAIDLLGNYKMVEPSDKQLSGIGFNNSIKESLIIKCSGSFKRILKIEF